MKKRFCGLIVLMLSGVSVFAQEQDSLQVEKLDEVVVSDSRFQLKRENSGKTVVKITAEELAKSQGKSVAELLNTKAGIVVNGNFSNAGQNISTFARGGSNRQVLVVIDGLQVNDPSNPSAEFDLRLLNLSQIESIEVVKGAASTLYGNSAATVVISITTKKARKDGLAIETISTIGTNQSQDDQQFNGSDFSNSVSVTAKTGKFSVIVSGGHQYTNGLSAVIGDEEDVFSRVNGKLQVGYAFSNKLNIIATAFYDKFTTDFDDSFFAVDAPFYFNSEQSRFTLSGDYKYNNGSVTVNGGYTSVTRNFESSFPSSFDSESFVVDAFNKYTFNNSLFTIIGVNVNEQTTLFSELEEKATSIDPYFNGVWVSENGLNINAGFRLNNHSEYGTNLIYNLNPSYLIRTTDGYFKFFGSYATSFIAPNLSQLFGPFGPNPDLDPETNTTIEGGVEYRPNSKFRASALYFNRNEEDRIDYLVVDPATFSYQYQNSDTEETFYGIEVELEAKPIEKLGITANYTYTKGESEPVLRRPEHVMNATFGYDFSENTFASLSYQYQSSRNDVYTDPSTFSSIETELESFGLLNAYVGHRLNDKVRFFVSMENIANTDYVEITNFTTRGRNMRLGLQLNL